VTFFSSRIKILKSNIFRTMMDTNEHYLSTMFLVADDKIKYPASFAIITAHNPMDQLLSKEENRNRNIQLLHSLEKLGAKTLPIVGCSPDLTHREDSFIVSVSLNTAISVGRKFDQRAVYWVQNENLYLVYCEKETKVMVAEFSSRILP
jgi:hypothetical protein